MLWLAHYRCCDNRILTGNPKITEKIGMFFGGNSLDVVSKVCQQVGIKCLLKETANSLTDYKIEDKDFFHFITVSPVGEMMDVLNKN